VNDITLFQKYMKKSGELPKYVSFDKYKELRGKVDGYYNRINMPNKRQEFLKVRDRLFIDFMFATGGRIADILRVKKGNIDFQTKQLTLDIKKTKRTIVINIDEALAYDISNYALENQLVDEDRLFKFTPTAGWYIIRKFGALIGINELHPHMFRHGLALYLLSIGVPINVIQYRLGHSNIKTTIDMYLKVTPEIEKQIMETIGVQWR